MQLQPAQHRLEPNPALVRQAEQRARSIENRIADRITAFAGSMPFVYIHIACDSGEAYARRLEVAGVETTLRRFSGHTHGSSVLWQTWKLARAWMEDVVAGLRRALHDPPAEVPAATRASGVA